MSHLEHNPLELLNPPRGEPDGAAQVKRQQELEDLRWLTAHEQGRRVARRLLEWGGLFRTSFNVEPQVAAFNEGRKQLAYFLTAELIDATPEQYIAILKGNE